jgi:hypothetical protein
LSTNLRPLAAHTVNLLHCAHHFFSLLEDLAARRAVQRHHGSKPRY